MKNWVERSFQTCKECCYDRGSNECADILEHDGLTFDEDEEGCGVLEKDE